ncbi:MAG: FapA family protein [candidate division Zixibacteria bacterium]|nr:FapA family protein [candidate division Zixibacteria bacterium]
MASDSTQTTDTSQRKRTRVTVSKDKLTAMLVINRPEAHEPEITLEEIMADLEGANIVHGIDKVLVTKCLEDKVYDTPIKVATGTPPKKGTDTSFEYLFQTTDRYQPQEGEDGRIDYRDMKYILNTTKDTVLVRMTSPTEGVPGKSVTGMDVRAAGGRNIPFESGENTRVSENGEELIANVDGAIIFSHGKVSVKDVLTIRGDVDYKVGNIDAVGSVKVAGNVFAGFIIKVGGDLEINGNVEDCTIKTNGNILVKGGFFGNGDGVMEAGGDITLKYAQGQRISAGNDLIVGGELVNCHATAKRNILVEGKKGTIVGGEVSAGNEIRTTVAGSDAGTATVLAVAYNAKLMRQYQDVIHERDRLKADYKRVKESLTSLYRLQMDGKLNAAQSVILKKLEEFAKDVPSAQETLEVNKKELENKIAQLKDAKIIVEGSLFPGVQIHVGVLVREIMEELKTCKLTGDGHKVVLSKFDRNTDL